MSTCNEEKTHFMVEFKEDIYDIELTLKNGDVDFILDAEFKDYEKAEDVISIKIMGKLTINNKDNRRISNNKEEKETRKCTS